MLGCLAACAAATAAAGDVEVVQVDTIVLGGGPAGVQQAAFLKARGRDFLLLERDSVPGSFFLRYPRHGKLISVNKPYTGTSNPEYNMRFDWHTLLSPLSEEAAANRTWRPPNRYHGALKTRQDVLAGINAPDLDADAASASRGGGGGGWNQALPHDMPRFDGRYSEDYFPSSPRVVDYLEDFIEHHGLRENIRYGTRAFRVLAGPDFDGAGRGEARGGGGGRKFVVKTTVSAAPGAACFDALYDGSSGGSGACPVREVHFVCRHIFVATGLSKPAAIRYHLPAQRKSERPRGPRMHGWEHVAIIDDFDLTLASYRNASVLVLGKGNSGFETANSLVPVADSVTVIARSPHRFSWQTHYPPNLRAVNNNFLQHARFLPGHHLLAEVDLTESAIVKAPGGKLRLLSRAEAEAVAAGTLALSAATDLLGRAYDHVISAVGFQFDFSVFAPPVRPVPFPNGRYPLSTAAYESANVPGMWFIGTLQHSRDFRRSSGGVLDGFRYLARATFYQMELTAHGRRWPATTVLPAVEREGGFAPLSEGGEPAPVAFDPWVQAVTELLMKRANEASGLFLMFTVLTDVILLRQDGATGAIVGATHFEDVPRDFIPALLADEERRAVEQAAAQGEKHGGAADAAFTLHVVTLNIEFGQCNGMKAGDIETDPFNAQGYGYFAVSPRMRYWRHEHRAGAGAPPAVDGAETAAGAAGAGFFDVTRPWAQHLVVEEQLATWYDEVEHVAPVRRFVRQVLLEGLEQPLAWPALVHLYQWPSQQDAPSCPSFVLWQSLRNVGSGMGMREFGWLAERLEGEVAKAEKKALDSDAASVADAAAGAAEAAAAVVGPEPGSAGDNDPATNGVTQNGGDWPLHQPHKNAFADACDGSDGPQRQKCAMSDRGFVPSVVRRSKDKLPHCDDAPWPEVPLRDGAEHEYDYIIVGAGPAGVQLAAHLQTLGGGRASVLLLERDGSPASFFRKYPRHRYLTSVNKRATGSADGEYNLRADWHTLLHPAGSAKAPLLFGEHSAEFHPFADDFVSYVCRYARHHEVPLALHHEVESITKDAATGSFSVAVGGGAGGGGAGGSGTKLLRAKQVVVATGLSLERGPHLAHPLTETYGTYDIDPAKYVNKTVMVLGNGASALEIAETLAAVTRTTHMLGMQSGPLSSSNFGFSFSSGYQEHPGATQSNFLDTYSLKTNNVYGLHDASEERDLFVRSEKTGQIHYMSRDGENGCGGAFKKLGKNPSEAALQAALEEHYFKPASADVLHPCFYGYDHVITAFGWSLDASILPPRAQHGVKRHKRTPRMSADFEASGVPGLFYAGELMHDAPAPKERGGSFSEEQQEETDEDGRPLEPAKKGPGRQWYGIRYRVQALARHLAAKNQGVGWLAAAAAGDAAPAAAASSSAAELLQRQIQSGSGSFLDAELVDVVLARAKGGAEGGAERGAEGEALLLDALPAGSLASMAAAAFGGAEAAAAAMGDVDAYFTLRWEAGVCFSFANNDRLVVSDPFRVAPGREGRQPVVRRFVRQAAAAVAAPAAGLGGYAEAGTLRLPYDRLARFADPAGKYRAALEAFVASRAVAPEPATALALASGAPSCTADVLWDRLQSPHSGLTLADLRWLRERAQELAAAKAVPLPLHDALMDFGVHEDMVRRNVSKHELFRYLVYTRTEDDDSPISQLSSGSRFMKEYAQQACDGKIAVSSKEQDYLARVLRKGCKFAASPDSMHPMFSGGPRRIGSAESEEQQGEEEEELREDEEDERVEKE